MRKIRLIIVSSNYSTVVYTNYGVSLSIVRQIKFTSSNIDCLNIKLVRVSIYLLQFRLNVYYRFGKSNLVFDVLSWLFTRSIKIDYIDALDIDNYVYNQVVVIINNVFRVKIQQRYLEDSVWKRLLSVLRKLAVAVVDEVLSTTTKAQSISTKTLLIATKAQSSSIKVSLTTIEVQSIFAETFLLLR